MRKLGRYALLHRFATGDHGDVYLARLGERLPRGELGVGDLCAVKVVRGDVATDIEHSRLLLAEGVTAVRFRHRAAVRVHEVEREGAEPFTAMDYANGQTLGAVLQREASQGSVLPPKLVAYIGAEIAAVLEAGAQRAWSPSGSGPMVHGGLSPRSVVVDYDGEVRVLGMGGGRARLYLPVPRSRLAYTAPEVLQQRAPDRRTDLFSLGVLLHDLLTSTRLFRRASDAETRDAIVEGRPADAAAALSSVDRDVARLVLAMLERHGDKRPRDAESVETALRTFAGDVPAARAELAERLERHFREEREAQRRVIDAAVRRAGAMPGARAPATKLVEPPGSGRPAERAPSAAGAERLAPAPRAASTDRGSAERTAPDRPLARVASTAGVPGGASVERGAAVAERAAAMVERAASGPDRAAAGASDRGGPAAPADRGPGSPPFTSERGRPSGVPPGERLPPFGGPLPRAASGAASPAMYGGAAAERAGAAASERPGTAAERAMSSLGGAGTERAMPSFGGAGTERAMPSFGGAGTERAMPSFGGAAAEVASERPLPRASAAREPAAQRDVPQMMRPITMADRQAARHEVTSPDLSGPVGTGSFLGDAEEPITISGMPHVRRSAEGLAAPLDLEPVPLAPAGGGAFDELLPELLTGRVPLLSERDDVDTLDIGRHAGVLEPRDPSGGTPIPLTQRARGERVELLAESTWDGELGGDLPAWGANLDLVPTFALALGPVDDSRAVPLADAEGSLSDLLASGAEVAEVEAAAEEPPPPTELAGPDVLRYRRARRLGVSEVATVYEAHDAVLGRAVALKVSEVGDESTARLDRDTRIRVLRREGRLAAELFHPRLPILLDAGRDAELYFLAYQLVEGDDLDRLVAQHGPVSPQRARVVLRDVGEALAFLHARRLSHGDVTAANVLIEPDGRARLIDFSMAVAEGTEHPLGVAHDPLADVRALGALGVWMVAGGPKPSDVAKLDPELAGLLARLEGASQPGELTAALATLDGGSRRSNPAARPPNAPSSPGARLPRATSSAGAPRATSSAAAPRAASVPGAPSTLDALERPAAPLGVGFEAIAQALESHLRRGAKYDPPDRDPSGPLSRAVARRLALGAEAEAVSALLLAARALTARFGMKPRQAVAEGLLAPVIGARLLELEERLLGGREADPTPTPLEVATVVEAYAQAIQPGEDGRRVSPRRAVVALRERADEGRFDGRVVEALIDQLRTTISALEVPPRDRLIVVGLAADDPVTAYLAARGYPVDRYDEPDPVVARGFAERPPWGIVTDRASARRLTERLRADGRAGEVPVIILGGGADDTLDEGAPLSVAGRVEVFPRTASPARILTALAERARPR